ncbi:putative serine threonine-protein kinase Sgk2 [Lyophyllum shimeji]|uniref:Serine threonine-protein kinase Sgk2 n=1 Tax=Lyophyllum shimeji TaxID=47721 RepID=A0A9P3PXC0_LYOSH|nr:putative serine threonine-protein kinase Sgk2 [Lyophyllum shimeji]
MDYEVAPMTKQKCYPEALKVSWPLPTGPLEADKIARLRRRLPPRWHKHIQPEVNSSALLTAELLKLPHHKLLEIPARDKFEDRQMHALAIKLYGKLREVGSIKAFQHVFVDCVECHYHAYLEGCVLHCDLSEGNLMFKVDAKDTVKGILNDWDMASYVDENNEIKLSTAKHRTGTIPFMARDLLVDEGTEPPPHLYRHDLESFFYILVWAAFHYDFARKVQRPRTLAEFSAWDRESLLEAALAKMGFIASSRAKDPLFRRIPEDSKPLLPWMNSVWALFRDSDIAYEMNRNSPDRDDLTLGGHITFENFMKALGRTR